MRKQMEHKSTKTTAAVYGISRIDVLERALREIGDLICSDGTDDEIRAIIKYTINHPSWPLSGN